VKRSRPMDFETRAYLADLRRSRSGNGHAQIQARKRAAAEREAAEWNATNPVGAPVTVTLDDGSRMETHTRTPAWVLGHPEVVVSVDGITGGYLLSRVRVRPGAVTTTEGNT
jgi:hypothetical protein